jgi:hypothetical protein
MEHGTPPTMITTYLAIPKVKLEDFFTKAMKSHENWSLWLKQQNLKKPEFQVGPN